MITVKIRIHTRDYRTILAYWETFASRAAAHDFIHNCTIASARMGINIGVEVLGR